MKMMANAHFAIPWPVPKRTITVAGGQVARMPHDVGISLEPQCMTGGCVARCMEGEVIDKDSCLSASDWNAFCSCVSRAQGLAG